MVLQAGKSTKPQAQIGLGCIYDVMNRMILESDCNAVGECRLFQQRICHGARSVTIHKCLCHVIIDEGRASALSLRTASIISCRALHISFSAPGAIASAIEFDAVWSTVATTLISPSKSRRVTLASCIVMKGAVSPHYNFYYKALFSSHPQLHSSD